MLKKQPADDLFEKSSMSFGEHLDELRKTFIKAFVWAGIGTLIGLYFADSLIKFLEQPLKKAIYQFHVDRAKELYAEANGEKPSEELAAFINQIGMMPEKVFISPESFIRTDGEESLEEVEKAIAAETAKANEEGSTAGGSTVAGDDPGKGEGASPEEENVSPKGENASEDLGDTPSEEELVPKKLNSENSGMAGYEVNPWEGVDLKTLKSLKPRILWRPVRNKLVSLDSVEGFMIWLKAGLVAGLVIGSPGILWHFWQFIAAGLYPHERRYVYWYLPLSVILFFSGVCLAFFVVFQLVLGFLMQYTASLDVEFTPRLTDYMSFALFLPLGFGIAFQLPLVMLGLHRFGIVTVETFQTQWRLAVLVIAFLAMLLTPAEIYSMIGLFVPLTGLYFFGIFLCHYMPIGAGIGSEGLDPA